jgi:hypothetical protein
MYSYKPSESHDGSHFFVKTPHGGVVRISLFKPSEDYVSEYLEDKIRHLIIYNYTDSKLSFQEGRKICETIAHLVYEFIAYNDCVVKIEVEHNSGKNHRVRDFLINRPNKVKGFVKENLESHDLYFIFNIDTIESTDLLYNLIEEYQTKEDE